MGAPLSIGFFLFHLNGAQGVIILSRALNWIHADSEGDGSAHRFFDQEGV